MELVVIGAGNLARALVEGWQRQQPAPAVQVLARSDRYRERGWRAEAADRVTRDPAVLAGADAVVLAVKPKDLPAAAELVQRWAPPTAGVISVLAGISLDRLQTAVGSRPLARAMPNICVAVGEGVVAVSFLQPTSAFAARVREWLRPLGLVAEVPEALLDAVTALSGSGPAYVYLLLNALVEAGTMLGLPADLARRLAAHTVRGTAAMSLARPDVGFEELWQEVASPGGTTEAALNLLTRQQVPEHLIEAVTAAARRARELGA